MKGYFSMNSRTKGTPFTIYFPILYRIFLKIPPFQQTYFEALHLSCSRLFKKINFVRASLRNYVKDLRQHLMFNSGEILLIASVWYLILINVLKSWLKISPAFKTRLNLFSKFVLNFAFSFFKIEILGSVYFLFDKRLSVTEIYGFFSEVLTKVKKFAKPEMKEAVLDLETKITECNTKVNHFNVITYYVLYMLESGSIHSTNMNIIRVLIMIWLRWRPKLAKENQH